uniref:Uncharacterized protein n=1 Tax=viral metagenome TaxID=1070528 RepID=A0A6C0JV94_9ZZZZ
MTFRLSVPISVFTLDLDLSSLAFTLKLKDRDIRCTHAVYTASEYVDLIDRDFPGRVSTNPWALYMSHPDFPRGRVVEVTAEVPSDYFTESIATDESVLNEAGLSDVCTLKEGPLTSTLVGLPPNVRVLQSTLMKWRPHEVPRFDTLSLSCSDGRIYSEISQYKCRRLVSEDTLDVPVNDTVEEVVIPWSKKSWDYVQSVPLPLCRNYPSYLKRVVFLHRFTSATGPTTEYLVAPIVMDIGRNR